MITATARSPEPLHSSAWRSRKLSAMTSSSTGGALPARHSSVKAHTHTQRHARWPGNGLYQHAHTLPRKQADRRRRWGTRAQTRNARKWATLPGRLQERAQTQTQGRGALRKSRKKNKNLKQHCSPPVSKLDTPLVPLFPPPPLPRHRGTPSGS